MIDNLIFIGQSEYSTFSIIKDIVLVIVAICGVVLAGMGLSTWKKQLKGNTEYQLARRLMIAVYKVRDSISSVRNPVMFSGEIQRALNNCTGVDTNDPSYHYKSSEAVYVQRLKKMHESLLELNIEYLEAQVFWGGTIIENFKPLFKCINELEYGIYIHLRILSGDLKRTEEYKDNDFVIIEGGSKNEYDARIKKVIELIETTIKPKLTMR